MSNSVPYIIKCGSTRPRRGVGIKLCLPIIDHLTCATIIINVCALHLHSLHRIIHGTRTPSAPLSHWLHSVCSSSLQRNISTLRDMEAPDPSTLPNPYTPLAFLPPEIADEYQILGYVYVGTLAVSYQSFSRANVIL